MSERSGTAEPVRFDDSRRHAWLRLIRSENVGPATFEALRRRFGSAEAALGALPELARRGGSKRAIRIATADDVSAEVEQAARLGARFVCKGETAYPRHLLQADGAPPVVAVMGDTAVLERPSVAVVGSRNASLAGTRFCNELCQDLGRSGFAVVSGLARGIDTAAHKASLATGTIGVFAGGLDRPYPDENRPLMRQIVDGGGCLVSEMPFGWAPRANDFPRRNRIIAGLSMGLVVVEAALRSGSLISARYAGDLGRLVFAVPGSPLDPRAAGANQILKDGAILVTDAADVIAALLPLDPRAASARRAETAEEAEFEPAPAPVGDDARSRILAVLGPVPTLVDDLIAHTGASAAVVQAVLIELDLAGRLDRHPGGCISMLP